MSGFAAHFLAVGDEGTLDTLPFLAASKLLAEGYGFGGREMSPARRPSA